MAAGRRYGPLAVILTVLALVAGGVPPVAFTGHPAGQPAPGILAPGSSGSIGHHSWWDPRSWFGGDGANASKPRVLAATGGPQVGRMPVQAKMPAPRRVRELTARRSATTRVYQLSDGRQQAVISAVPVN